MCTSCVHMRILRSTYNYDVVFSWISSKQFQHFKQWNILYSCLRSKVLDMSILAILCRHYILYRWETYSQTHFPNRTTILHDYFVSTPSLYQNLLWWVRGRISASPFSFNCHEHRQCSFADNLYGVPTQEMLSIRAYSFTEKGNCEMVFQAMAPSGHDSIRQCLSFLQMSSTNQVNPLLFIIYIHPSSASCMLIVSPGSDKLSKVCHGHLRLNKGVEHMSKMKL